MQYPSTAGHPVGRRFSPATRGLFALLLTLHGIAHLVGFVDGIDAAGNDGAVEYVFERWTITSAAALWIAAGIWAALAAGFAMAAGAVWVAHPAWPRLLVVVTAVSLIMTTLALPTAAVGLVVNAVLLALLVTVARTQPDTRPQLGTVWPSPVRPPHRRPRMGTDEGES